MLPNFSRFSRKQPGRERSPFSSPNSNLHPSPIAARRSSLEERRRPAAKFDHGPSAGPAHGIDDQDQEEENGNEEDQEEESDEDEAGELSPLLPIFSAAHLGMSTPPLQNSHSMDSFDPLCRRSTSLQSHAYLSSARRATMRDHTLLGPAKVPTSLTIPRQANPATDSNLPFLQGYTICFDGKLPAVQQGGVPLSRQQWCKQDKGAGL